MIIIHCPECGTRHEVAESAAGAKGKCRHCRAVIQVPNRREHKKLASNDEEVECCACHKSFPRGDMFRDGDQSLCLLCHARIGQTPLMPTPRSGADGSGKISRDLAHNKLVAAGKQLPEAVRPRDHNGRPSTMKYVVLGVMLAVVGASAVIVVDRWMLQPAGVTASRGSEERQPKATSQATSQPIQKRERSEAELRAAVTAFQEKAAQETILSTPRKRRELFQTDPEASFRKFAEDFITVSEPSGKISGYDVQKTNSIVTPYLGILEAEIYGTALGYRWRFKFGGSNGLWDLKDAVVYSSLTGAWEPAPNMSKWSQAVRKARHFPFNDQRFDLLWAEAEGVLAPQ